MTPASSPTASPGHRPRSLIANEAITLISPMTMPTDRSNPPAKITIVCPQAAMPRIELCRATLRRLFSL